MIIMDFAKLIEAMVECRKSTLFHSKLWIDNSKLASTIKTRNACIEVAKAFEAVADSFLSLMEAIKEEG